MKKPHNDEAYARTSVSTPSQFKTNDFKELEKQWYQKLADTGFEDLEDTTREDRPLRTWVRDDFAEISERHPGKIGDNTAFYEAARALLHTHRFKNRTHRRIWELHCEGHSVRDIAEMIGKPAAKSWIGRVVKKITREVKKNE